MSLNSSCNEKCFREKWRENKTHFILNDFSFRKSCPLWNNVVKYCIARQATGDNVAHAIEWSIPKATNTHSDYVILTAFPLQQWLHERTSMSRCTCIACFVNVILWTGNSGNWLAWVPVFSNWESCIITGPEIVKSKRVWTPCRTEVCLLFCTHWTEAKRNELPSPRCPPTISAKSPILQAICHLHPSSETHNDNFVTKYFTQTDRQTVLEYGAFLLSRHSACYFV